MSVPNQYSADGSRVRREVVSAVGSTVHRYGASTAISTISDQQRAADGDGRMAAQEAGEAAPRLDRRQQVRQRRRRDDVAGRRGDGGRRAQ